MNTQRNSGHIFHDHCHGFTSAEAQCGQSQTKLAAGERVQKCDKHPRPTGADGMTESNCAAVDIELGWIDAKRPDAGQTL